MSWSRKRSHLLPIVLAVVVSLLVLGLCPGGATAATEIYPSKAAAKKAVIAKTRKRWTNTKLKVKVENAATKKNMTAEQKKAYKKCLKNAGKKAKKYRFYIVTITDPEFTISAKYKDSKGNIKTYKLKAQRGGYFCSYSSGVAETPASGELSSRKRWRLWAVRKGCGSIVVYECSDEANRELTGKRGTFGDVSSIETKSTKYELKG